MSKGISAIVCTHNRARHLALAVRSLVNQRLPADRYEIIVVDNASTDGTRQVVEDLSGLADIRYLYEPTLGLSHARNSGWRNALAPFAAYLDDDAVASPGWLENILEVFARITPRPGCVGGRVTPLWEAPRPPWLSDELLTGLTIIDWSDEPHALGHIGSEWLVGSNMAVPVDVLQRIGGFAQGLDRTGRHLLGSGDVYLQTQIMGEGLNCYYHPGILVEHRIEASRLQKAWFAKRYFWQGVSDARMYLLACTPSVAPRLKQMRSMMFRLLAGPDGIRHLFSATDDPKRFTRKCFALIALGHVAGLSCLRQEKRQMPQEAVRE